MLKITLFAVWISLALCYGAPQKVVGGGDAPPGSAPHIVNLREAPPTSYFFCGGSIIGKRTVITAGHCILGRQAWNVIVTTGSQSMSSGGTRYMATDLIVHPNYHEMLLANDLAIVIVEQDFELSSNVAIIPLATEPVPDGSQLVLTGWGTLEYGGSLPDYLQILSMTIVNNEQCRVYYGAGSPVYPYQVCTYNGVGYGSCNGDSGGPLVTEDGKLYALVSWGYGCASGAPDVNTLVPSFKDWISEHIV